MESKTPVLIVGAGPTGLVLALWLRARNVPFRLVDKAAAPGETSRAIAIQARTLEFYDQLGIADDIIRAGLRVDSVNLFRRGRHVAEAKIGSVGAGRTTFPFLIFLPQDVHEKILNERLHALGAAVERGVELIDFEQDDSGVIARLKTARGGETVRADYLCGGDGAHSAVRHGADIGFPGGTYEQVFFVADVRAAGEMADGRLGISVSRESFCIVMPVKSRGSMRLTGLVPPESETKERVSWDDVADSVARDTGLRVERVNWFSSYRIHHRVAAAFRRGRVFLAGDAGHIHSPAGGQGMNTGIGDAVNLGWKLAAVVRGEADPRILDTYETERIAFARRLVASTDRAFTVIASRSFLGRLWRDRLLARVFAALTKSRAFLRLAFLTISQTRIRYRDSALSEGPADRVRAGDRLPWVPIGPSHNFAPLTSLDWQIHVYGRLDEAARAGLPFPVHVFAFTDAVRERGLRENAFYVIRPDGHIGAVASSTDEVNAYARRRGLRASARAPGSPA